MHAGQANIAAGIPHRRQTADQYSDTGRVDERRVGQIHHDILCAVVFQRSQFFLKIGTLLASQELSIDFDDGDGERLVHADSHILFPVMLWVVMFMRFQF